MPVIHVKVGFRPGLPEVDTRNRLFASIKSSPEHQKLFEGEQGSILDLFEEDANTPQTSPSKMYARKPERTK